MRQVKRTCARWVNKWSFNILTWMPESFSPTSVELWYRLGELESRGTTNFTSLEMTSWAPPVALGVATVWVLQSGAKFG